MEHLEELIAWLMTFPQWGDADLTVDITGTAPGDCGLFPLGVEVLESREDVLGRRHSRLRQQFLLRRTGVRGADAAAWLLAFQQWAARHADDAPQFGTRQVLRAEKGRLINAAQTGTGTYEVRLTAEYNEGE